MKKDNDDNNSLYKWFKLIVMMVTIRPMMVKVFTVMAMITDDYEVGDTDDVNDNDDEGGCNGNDDVSDNNGEVFVTETMTVTMTVVLALMTTMIKMTMRMMTVTDVGRLAGVDSTEVGNELCVWSRQKPPRTRSVRHCANLIVVTTKPARTTSEPHGVTLLPLSRLKPPGTR